MKTPEEASIFETNNISLASFLILEGIRLLECKNSQANSRIVVMRFLDENQNCMDLERVFLNSDFKKYFDINKYLLGKVHEILRG